jgi:uncharacterized protein
MVLPVGSHAASPGSLKLPDPLGYVSDHAGVLEAEWKARIRSVCEDLERKTGVEMVVVTVPQSRPYASAKEYAEALYQRWGIGTAQQEHGVLVLAVVETRQASVTIGRSLYGALPPPRIEQVGRENLEPLLRHGHFGEGLYRAVVALASNVQEFRIGVRPRSHLKGLGIWLTAALGLAALWFLWWISRPDLRHPYGKIRRGEYWGSGQGGFGGNFGGGMNSEGWK